MKRKPLNTGVVYTNEKCIGCNRCISGCVAVGANVVIKAENFEQCKVLVDPNKCIQCGSCVRSCVHKARTYRDDTDAFFDALAAGEEISILVSPTLLTDYETQYHNILGYLRQRGVRHIYNTAYGGDLMVWVCMNFIQDFGLSGVISQCCPVIVNYLEKYKAELLPYLMPVHSPMMCTAIYVSDYLKIKDKLAYISPCIATKQEIDDVNTYGKVSYNVTIERLMSRLAQEDLTGYYAEDEIGYGLGALMSQPGGLSDNIELYTGFNEVLIQTEGPNNIFPYFDHYYTEVAAGERLPFLVDALSCTHGCNFGTGTSCGAELRNKMTFSSHRVKENAYTSGVVAEGGSAPERMERLNQQFREFELSSFVRQYDATRQEPRPVVEPDAYERIFNDMYKITEAQRHTDCGSCGYTTCRAMAYAIAIGVNIKDNCINYAKECIRQETEKISGLLDEISSINEELKRSTQLKSNFLANMSHEIRTPMNAIIGMAELAMRGRLGDEEKSYIQQIQSSGRSLLAIINDILDFSKIESGRMELSENSYKVMTLLSETVNIAMTRIGDKDIQLLVRANPNIPATLYGDDIRIKQVLVNLASNAVKFTARGFVELTLDYEPHDHGILLKVTVQDSGIGIREEDIQKLFSSFQQVDSKRNRNMEGTGLGLAISREFVMMMNGEIGVESVYGQGSTFSFAVPQLVVEERPSVTLKGMPPVRIATLLHNQHQQRGFAWAAQSLPGVEHRVCHSLEEMEEAIDAGAGFIFFDYPNWNDRTAAFAHAHPAVQTVVLVDARREVVNHGGVRKLHLPVYCHNLAAVLNGESANAYDQECIHSFCFEAPQARVMVVDDNTVNLTVTKGLLSPLKMQITSVSSAREAIRLLRQGQRYDIVFMDHMMPDIDGVEATHIIRALEGDYYRQLPIIALTANVISEAREMFLKEGMNDFVAKPIEMRDITDKLLHWLPPEKICTLGDKDRDSEAAEKPPGLEIPGLDTAAALGLSGSVELYKTILGDYHRGIAPKADLIESYWQQQALESYTVEVHALKSASRLIGATELADLAAHLEQCGHQKNWESIQAETPGLLALYRSYQTVLEPYAAPAPQALEAVDSINPEMLDGCLLTLAQALDDFDLDSAVAQTQLLGGIAWEEPESALCKELVAAVEAMEYDDAAQLARQWRQRLQPQESGGVRI